MCQFFRSETALDHTDDIFLAPSETCVFMLWREFAPAPGFILIHCMFFYIQYSVNIGLSKEPISNFMYFADVSVQTSAQKRTALGHIDDIFLAPLETCVFMLWRDFVPGFILILHVFLYTVFCQHRIKQKAYLSQNMRFPTMWDVRPAKAQTISAV